jgi:FkbM family methyltransferase
MGLGLRWVADGLNTVLAGRGWVLDRRPRPLIRRADAVLRPDFDMVVSHLLRRVPEPFFVQVGAYDGVGLCEGKPVDALWPWVSRGGWRGVFVEPQPGPFARLVETHGGRPGLAFENAAIGTVDGDAVMYRVRPEPGVVPEWMGMLTSFSKDVLLKHRYCLPDLPDRIEAVTVKSLTFKTLLARHGVSRMDVLVVDTEGFDFEILKMADLASTRPAVVHYEHVHLSGPDREACLDLLIGLGYRVAEGEVDTCAYLRPE